MPRRITQRVGFGNLQSPESGARHADDDQTKLTNLRLEFVNDFNCFKFFGSHRFIDYGVGLKPLRDNGPTQLKRQAPLSAMEVAQGAARSMLTFCLCTW